MSGRAGPARRPPAPVHYVRRFFGSWSRRPPSAADTAWAESVLGPRRLELWARLGPQDRRHLVEGARAVDAALGDDDAVVAALLHDVGKFHADLGTLGRSAATVAVAVAGRPRVESWAGRPGWRGRWGRYAVHGAVGGREIRAAGGPEIAAVWSEVHHFPERFAGCGIPPEVLAALDAADR